MKLSNEQSRKSLQEGDLLFTYGILQSMSDPQAEIVSKDMHPEERYEMRRTGFPLIKRNPEGHFVKGVLFRIHNLAIFRRTDSIEGEGSFYHRILRRMKGTDLHAWVYEILEDKLFRGDPVAPDGNGFLIWDIHRGHYR